MSFGKNALVDDLLQMPSEERLQHTLAHPSAPGAMPLGRADRITTARIRYALAEMSHELYPEVLRWIRTIAAENPVRAVELYMELVQFSVPKVKAIAIDQSYTEKPARAMSLAELEQSVISEQ
jgi:hypothetical protein